MPHGFSQTLRFVERPIRGPKPVEEPEPSEEQPGPQAEGPVGEGARFDWIFVWLIQNLEPEGRVAAAYGESPKGKTFTGTWSIDTEMAHVSASFSPGRPALATAMARVVYPNGDTKVEWWTDPVVIADDSAASAP
jgi:hypothetical protein